MPAANVTQVAPWAYAKLVGTAATAANAKAAAPPSPNRQSNDGGLSKVDILEMCERIAPLR
jgi:hypothetical protein